MSLSDNILAVGYNHIEAEDGVIHTKDVKDFIKALKKKLNQSVHDGNNLNIADAEFDINKLAGDKLI